VRDSLDGYLVPYGDVSALAGAIERALARGWDRTALIEHAKDAASTHPRRNGSSRDLGRALVPAGGTATGVC
jgi:hypothetical protein